MPSPGGLCRCCLAGDLRRDRRRTKARRRAPGARSCGQYNKKMKERRPLAEEADFLKRVTLRPILTMGHALTDEDLAFLRVWRITPHRKPPE